MDEQQATIILQVIRENLALPNWTVMRHEPFETLIATIISQNTADTNTRRAFETLSNQFEVTPKELSEAEIGKLEYCLHVAGLCKNKSKTIKAVSKIIQEKFGGSLDLILSLPLNEARRTLMNLPGVGPKTADVVLLFCVNQPTVPVDTHVNRVSKRLGLAPEVGDYEVVRLSLQALFPPKDYLALHLLLITHGRKYCKATKPLCIQCPVNSYCPSKSMGAKND
jgi:endonuclease III